MTEFNRRESIARWKTDAPFYTTPFMIATLIAGDRVLEALSTLENAALCVSTETHGAPGAIKLERLGAKLEALAKDFVG